MGGCRGRGGGAREGGGCAHAAARCICLPGVQRAAPCLPCSYTLGGFYLARYDDSPVGQFDEVRAAAGAAWLATNPLPGCPDALPCAPPQLVALAGLVWNAPTSCAWAARVYVDNK